MPDCLSDRVIRFIECLEVPAGKRVGEKIHLRDWQRDFVRDVYRTTPDGRRPVRQAILTMARRNGKTLLSACFALAHLIGPCKRKNALLISAANDRFQAGICFKLAADIVRASPILKREIRIADSLKKLYCNRTNSTYMAVSRESATKLGLGPDLVVFDELGAARDQELFEVLQTGLGSQLDPLMLSISTQAPDDAHFFSRMIDYGRKIKAGEITDDSFLLHDYFVEEDADIWDEKNWYLANPGLDDYRDLGEMREFAKQARHMPSKESRFRNLYLNQRVRVNASFLAKAAFDGCDAAPGELLPEMPVYGGLDLSSTNDLTAFALIQPRIDGTVGCWMRYWMPEEGLEERSAESRAPYAEWGIQGHLTVTPGNVVDYKYVAVQLAELLQGLDVAAIAYDRWRIEVFKSDLVYEGIDLPIEAFGQGYKDMAPAVSETEVLVADQKLQHGGNPILRWCVSNAVATQDAAGNRKLDKSRSGGKIDGAVALVMAVGIWRNRQALADLDVAAMIG